MHTLTIPSNPSNRSGEFISVSVSPALERAPDFRVFQGESLVAQTSRVTKSVSVKLTPVPEGILVVAEECEHHGGHPHEIGRMVVK